ncbi:TetR/AcrR family transcriptional regulator [Mycolicibacterium porcinum]|uniref:TetR family transcriptional regulator n=1 Tax=Mycolicibacterium porcinum TaxID=39693 RepID=A0AAW5T6Z5_9MYCO|nr:TetR family transcriptional regulator [Mycolicibacterium porcinum]MBX8689191.1 TetR family transcriptional regulator [Mycobacterium sp. 20091114027_K0903767]OCB44332.1 TetR family transcriptional regulator [Mycolicibacterium vulneris]MCV7390172.1 TetR family transcriptional regulator [Mycolicibacterium porcinum]ORB37582.1 TetR family transcriptional regulator [Mycolicibacterium porcinum]CDO30016.1 TetR family transcriptional regulator [Mycolicibacterium vulneris]
MVDDRSAKDPTAVRLTRAETQARTRAALLEAAAETCARKGYAAASVDEIAAVAGYSVGAVYSNFSSKENLFSELMNERASGRLDKVVQTISENADGGPLTALGRMLVEIADNEIEFEAIQAEFWLHSVRNPDAMVTLRDRSARTLASLREILAETLERNNIDDSVSVDGFAVVVLALFQGLVRQRRIDPDRVPEELFGQALAWQLAGMPKKANKKDER